MCGVVCHLPDCLLYCSDFIVYYYNNTIICGYGTAGLAGYLVIHVLRLHMAAADFQVVVTVVSPQIKALHDERPKFLSALITVHERPKYLLGEPQISFMTAPK